MANFDDIASGTMNMVNNTLLNNSIENFTSLVGSPLEALLTVTIGGYFDFNALNHGIMVEQMTRNIVRREELLDYSGSNAYIDGNPELMSEQLVDLSYTAGNNYTEFVNNANTAKKGGQLVTRTTNGVSKLFNKQNLYLDSDDGFDGTTGPKGGNPTQSGLVEFTGDNTDKNSILYKTKQLIRDNKIKTIISEFHTNGIDDPDAVGDETYGQSHGRNLLTKSAEKGNGSYSVNGYDNPYCRVWTHHYQYDRLARTMRANTDGINTWAGFEWNKTDKGHKEDKTKYGDGENYDYAWRGHHNQARRWENSVLDPKTGLVKMTPQYRGGRESNRHTKECMFSIENLAWKDYDPYSFEQALSWEQRGPMGGRIMWFPPYGITITETSSARWNSNDFIGRGEPVYTYVNSERTGNLSFIMLTDHPSSIDYASWWDDNPLDKNLSEDATNAENDYLRYFAGCANGDNGPIEETETLNDNKTGGLVVKPTPLTDEYIQVTPPLIKGEEIKPDTIPPEVKPPKIEDPIKIGFFVFYPNNYSGVDDAPSNSKSPVDAIAYLLGGKNAQKLNGDTGEDIPINGNNFFYDEDTFIGYEMGRVKKDKDGKNVGIGITTDDCMDIKEYIPRGLKGKSKDTFKADTTTGKKWQYRIDHTLKEKEHNGSKYEGGDKDPNNKITEDLKILLNYKDNTSYKLNLVLNDEAIKKDEQLSGVIGELPTLCYSFAEIAAAMYSEEFYNSKPFHDYLIECLEDSDDERVVSEAEERIEKLINLFKDESRPFLGGRCMGFASSHGYDKLNHKLAENRANNIIKWLSNNSSKGNTFVNNKPQNATESSSEQPGVIENTTTKNCVLKVPNKDVNSMAAKLYRSAYCELTFGASTSKSVSQTNQEPEIPEGQDTPTYECKEYKGFRWLRAEPKNDGTVWNYYEKDGSITYYEQEAKSADNYEKAGEGDAKSTEENVIDIFKEILDGEGKNTNLFSPIKNEIIRDNECYRGDYNDKGYFIDTINYKNITFEVLDFNESEMFRMGQFVSYKNKTYEVESSHVGPWDDNDFRDITSLRISYAVDDFVFYNDKYYKSKKNFIEEYPEFVFREEEWTKITPNNIDDYLVQPYAYFEDEPESGYEVDDIIYRDDIFQLCTKVLDYQFKPNMWADVDYPVFDETNYEWDDSWEVGTKIIYDDGVVYALYECVNATAFDPLDRFDDRNWSEITRIGEFSNKKDYSVNDMAIYSGTVYKAIVDINHLDLLYEWSDDLTRCFKDLVYDTKENTTGEFDCTYPYIVGELCRVDDSYYKSNIDIADQTVEPIPFNPDDWVEATDDELHSYYYFWELTNLVDKAAAALCWTRDKVIENISGTAKYEVEEPIEDFSCIWKYGETNKLDDGVTPQTDLLQHINSCFNDENKINFTSDEQNYLAAMFDENTVNRVPTVETIQELEKFIVAYRVLDEIKYIQTDQGDRKACTEAAEDDEEMNVKTERLDESETEGCTNVWVDRGDGLLIQECNIGSTGGQSRFNPETGEGDWNKLRYDQEYHFYKQYMEEHPFVFDKLQEKIKYFNPAFHSMTPEGFNARLTFLQQCTRQGNTKTMSDMGGNTANNLAFGRPPYCVLRLGDFYNQMIVIDNVSFDYDVSGGLQWDMNTEGNGLQPMLCKVNISFKFIGGGDITGPVQRLQNAMSFNYYANTSFYDNRADRVQYQATNWETMGGAGNNQMDYEKSYAFVAQRYQTQDPNMVSEADF